MCRDSHDVINQAKQAQTSGGYNADNFQRKLLKKETIICGLRDGQGSWYTTVECVEQSNYSSETLHSKLQICVPPGFDPRNKVGYYEVLEDTYVAYGQVLNNPIYGEGGYTQYYIPNFEDILGLLYVVDLSQ